MTVRLLIGTPTANGILLADHVAALLAMSRRLDAAGLDWRYRTIDGPNAGIGRDWLARDCLAEGCTHLLLLEGDVSFSPDLAERLIGRGRAVVGAICARGAPDLDRMAVLVDRHGFDDALALCQQWSLEPLGPDLAVVDGLLGVAAIGPGALLVERACLETLAASGSLVTYTLLDGSDRLLAFFRDLHEADAPWDGDYAFSRRWRGGGGKVFADVTADVRRIGAMRFGLPFSDLLQAVRATSDAPARPHVAGA